MFKKSLLISLAGLLFCSSSFAASEEIQVYQDDLVGSGKFGLDVHNNYVFNGSRLPEYPGQMPADHAYRLTPEFYYGLSTNLELGWYVLGTQGQDGINHYEGSKVRLKYIAPHDEQSGAFWGVNLEVGKTKLLTSPNNWDAELKGIAGYRAGKWSYAANLNLDSGLTKGSGPVVFSIDLKTARAVSDSTQLGLEMYNELGALSHPDNWSANSKTLYAVLDQNFDKFDLNLGVGHRLTSVGDKLLIKMIVGTHF